jgi:hypothetical protein
MSGFGKDFTSSSKTSIWDKTLRITQADHGGRVNTLVLVFKI